MNRRIGFLLSLVFVFSGHLLSCSTNDTKFIGHNKRIFPPKESPQVEPPPTTQEEVKVEEADALPDETPEHAEIADEEQPILVIKNPTILIMDYRSGWWGGDGGFFYEQVINDLNETFENKLVIEYHHILPSDGVGVDEDLKFVNEDWSRYTQIWILSGSEGSGDMELNDPYFQTMKEKIAASSAGLLIGAGCGSTMHANPIMEALGYDKIFASNFPPGRILTTSDEVTVVSRMEKQNKKLLDHRLFENSDGLADVLRIKLLTSQGDLKGDYFLDDDNFYTIGFDTENRNSIGVRKSGRKIILDAGIQRFYAMFNSDERTGTLKYLYNIVGYLGSAK